MNLNYSQNQSTSDYLLFPNLPNNDGLTKGGMNVQSSANEKFRRVSPQKTDILTDAGRFGDIDDISGIGDGITAYKSVLGSALDNIMEK